MLTKRLPLQPLVYASQITDRVALTIIRVFCLEALPRSPSLPPRGAGEGAAFLPLEMKADLMRICVTARVFDALAHYSLKGAHRFRMLQNAPECVFMQTWYPYTLSPRKSLYGSMRRILRRLYRLFCLFISIIFLACSNL